MLKVNIQLP